MLSFDKNKQEIIHEQVSLIVGNNFVITFQERQGDVLRWTLLALVLAVLGLRLQVVYTGNINWDEFHHFAIVYEYLRGELGSTLQTFYVHFFGWLAGVSDNEVEQVIAARVILYALSVAT